jgi:hypothetical protein
MQNKVESHMKFEDAGRTIDRELTNLRDFVAHKVKPTTRQEMAKVLRKTAARLSKLAQDLEQPEGGKPSGM